MEYSVMHLIVCFLVAFSALADMHLKKKKRLIVQCNVVY